MIKLALLGRPVAHSLSPALHAACGRSVGVAVDYRLIDRSADALDTWLSSAEARALDGFNITAPHKQAVAQRVAERTPAAARTGAVNTVKPGEAGWIGHNTDVEGFAAALGTPPGPNALVLGAGGAARAVVLALVTAGVEVIIANRTPARAAALLDALGVSGRVAPSAAVSGALTGTDLLVNTTAPAASSWVAGLPFDRMRAHARVIDINCGARAAVVVQAARRAGIEATDGLDMLGWQGLASFEFWTGLRPDPQVVLGALRVATGEFDTPERSNV